MLSKAENDILCQVGPGTPMGDLMRNYWLPAVRSDELPAPDSVPMRIRLLGENLIAFRDSYGRVGVIKDACPHRGASMFFGRNEEGGLRCVYHGWKFDVEGNCVDMPSEPAESNFKNKVHATAYPCRERNGIAWCYMGPNAQPPSLPDLEATMLPADRFDTSIVTVMRECNYMQALEGDIDTVHSNFLHDGAVDVKEVPPGTADYYRRATKAPKFTATDTPFGTMYAAYVPAEADSTYWRFANFLFPCFTMTPSGVLGAQITVRAWVPIDDQNTMAWTVRARRVDLSGLETYRSPMRQVQSEVLADKQGHGPLPETTGWLGRGKLGANASNDYMIDREAQKQMLTYTGIPTIFLQDQAVTESMGAIYQRDHEHLGTTDSMIIRTRRRLIRAAEALSDRGELPPGVRDASVYRARSGWCVLPNGVDWLEGTAGLREGFVHRDVEELETTAPKAAQTTAQRPWV